MGVRVHRVGGVDFSMALERAGAFGPFPPAIETKSASSFRDGGIPAETVNAAAVFRNAHQIVTRETRRIGEGESGLPQRGTVGTGVARQNRVARGVPISDVQSRGTNDPSKRSDKDAEEGATLQFFDSGWFY